MAFIFYGCSIGLLYARQYLVNQEPQAADIKIDDSSDPAIYLYWSTTFNEHDDVDLLGLIIVCTNTLFILYENILWYNTYDTNPTTCVIFLYIYIKMIGNGVMK